MYSIMYEIPVHKTLDFHLCGCLKVSFMSVAMYHGSNYLYSQVALWHHHVAEHSSKSSVCLAPQEVFSLNAGKWQCSTNRRPFLMLNTQGRKQHKYIINTIATVSTHFSSSLEGFLMTLLESSWHLSSPWDLSHLLWPITIHNNLWPLTFSVVMLLLEFIWEWLKELWREASLLNLSLCLSVWEDKRRGQSTLSPEVNCYSKMRHNMYHISYALLQYICEKQK